jgi:hypothetical protein
VFKNSNTPNHAVSSFDALTVLDLWRSLESECKDDCEFLTIPHNINKTWGIAYSGKTIDGDSYNNSDWALRGRVEPIAEIFQAKGNSECGFGVGAREGLKIGLELKQQLGFNPLQFGFIGSTDTHNSNPGDTEEMQFAWEPPRECDTHYSGAGLVLSHMVHTMTDNEVSFRIGLWGYFLSGMLLKRADQGFGKNSSILLCIECNGVSCSTGVMCRALANFFNSIIRHTRSL